MWIKKDPRKLGDDNNLSQLKCMANILRLIINGNLWRETSSSPSCVYPWANSTFPSATWIAYCTCRLFVAGRVTIRTISWSAYSISASSSSFYRRHRPFYLQCTCPPYAVNIHRGISLHATHNLGARSLPVWWRNSVTICPSWHVFYGQLVANGDLSLLG